MADINRKQTDNVAGPWFVDTECIFCGLCESEAPTVFGPSEDGDHYRVHHQPSDDEERRAAQVAMDRCPATCIGSNGDGS